MALSLSAAAILEKNKLSSDGAWLILLKICIPTLTPEPNLYLVRNTDSIVWNGNTYIAFPFELDDVSEDSKGEIPSVTVRVGNATRAVQSYIEQAGGGVGCTVTIYVVHSKHLDLMTAEVQEEFSVQSVTADENYVNFTLGASYPLYARRPERRYLKNFCPYEYGDVECGIDTAVYPVACDHTIVSCRARSNSTRYGGEPSIPQGGFYV